MHCPHTEQGSGRQVCSHLLGGLDDNWTTEQFRHYRRFTGHSLNYVLTCPECREYPLSELSWVCDPCFVEIAHGSRLGTSGRPQVAETDSGLKLQQVDSLPPEANLLQVVPFEKGWAALTETNELILLDSGRRRAFPLARWELPLYEELTLVAREPYVAIASTFGTRGVVVDTATGQVSMSLERAPSPACRFPLGFTRDGLLVHGPQLSDPASGAPVKTLHNPEDFHQSSLSPSPDQGWLAMNGWVWHPMGEVRLLNLNEDRPSRALCRRDGLCDAPLVWLGPNRLGVWGLGELDVMLLPGLRVFDLETQQELSPILGPEGPFAFDQYLFCHTTEDGFSVWDIETGQRVYLHPQVHPLAYHPAEKLFLVQTPQGLTLNRLQ
ncbi:MAG: hypothetical protein KIS61_05695 [Candidatus Eremiobacteraeota bacterium]|nr:hypothetical protein [Candidatus Eremiobacteraeota bacterium]